MKLADDTVTKEVTLSTALPTFETPTRIGADVANQKFPEMHRAAKRTILAPVVR